MAARYIDKDGFKMSQSLTNPAIDNIKQVQSIVPSQSSASFGGVFNIIVNNIGIEVNRIVLLFNTSAVSGLTGTDANYPLVVPSEFWMTKINIYVTTNIVETVYPEAEFLLTQLVSRDDKRSYDNLAQGPYLTPLQRRAMALTNNQSWAVDISHIFRELRYVLASNNHSLRFEITMNTVANIVSQGGTLTGTPVFTLNSAQLQMYSTNLSANHINYISQQIASPQNYKMRFHETRYFSSTVVTGSTTAQITLNGITGNVAFLMFFGRLDGNTTNENYFKFAPISQFDILDGSSTSIIGGTPITQSQNQTNLGKLWTRSTYLLEPILGTNNSYVYIWSFSIDPMDALTSGKRLGSKYFSGQNQLKLFFPSALSANLNLSVYAFTEANLVLSPQGANKMTASTNGTLL